MDDKGFSKLGGLITLVSIFLPIRYLLMIIGGSQNERLERHKTLFGLVFNVFSSKERTTRWLELEYYPLEGILVGLLLLVMSILIVVNANKGEARKIITFGIISIAAVIIEMVWFYIAIIPTTIIIYPHIGFFGILIGGILSIFGGNKLK